MLKASNVVGESQRKLLCDTEEREEMLSKGGGWSKIIAPNGQVGGGLLKGETKDIAYVQVNLDNRIPIKGAFEQLDTTPGRMSQTSPSTGDRIRR